MVGRKERARVVALRWSILAAAGIVPLACSGKYVGRNTDDDRGAGGSGGNTSTPGKGGTAPTIMGTSGSGTEAGSGAGGAISPVGTGGTGPVSPPRCTNPRLDPITGYQSCDEGYTHRPEALICGVAGEGGAGGESRHGAAGAGGQDGEGMLPLATGDVSCWEDPAICAQFQRGYCEPDDDGYEDAAVCRSGCRTDEDCPDRQFCSCDPANPAGGACVYGACQTDADCLAGYRCASYDTGCGGGWACQLPTDACTSDADCPLGQYCYPSGERENGSRECQEGSVCGRPFLVQSEARVASLTPRADWLACAEDLPELDGLTPEIRAARLDVWSRMALLEHASIAAFARFNLQLLALAAPASLLEECTRAIADETAHARVCFAMASAFAGRPLGPGPLDLAHSLEPCSLEEVVDLVLAEGCFGETGAALEAREAAERERDPAIVRAYQRIARDEQRHAELAFRFVRWALEVAPDAVAARLARACRSGELREHPASAVAIPCLQALLTLAEQRASSPTAGRSSLSPS